MSIEAMRCPGLGPIPHVDIRPLDLPGHLGGDGGLLVGRQRADHLQQALHGATLDPHHLHRAGRGVRAGPTGRAGRLGLATRRQQEPREQDGDSGCLCCEDHGGPAAGLLCLTRARRRFEEFRGDLTPRAASRRAGRRRRARTDGLTSAERPSSDPPGRNMVKTRPASPALPPTPQGGPLGAGSRGGGVEEVVVEVPRRGEISTRRRPAPRMSNSESARATYPRSRNGSKL